MVDTKRLVLVICDHYTKLSDLSHLLLCGAFNVCTLSETDPRKNVVCPKSESEIDNSSNVPFK